MPGWEAAWGAWERGRFRREVGTKWSGSPMHGLFHVKQLLAVWSLPQGPEGVEITTDSPPRLKPGRQVRPQGHAHHAISTGFPWESANERKGFLL